MNGHRGFRECVYPSAGLNHENSGRVSKKRRYAPARRQQSVATQNSHRHEVTKSYMFRHCIEHSKLQELLLSAVALTYARLSAVSCQVTPLTLSRLQTDDDINLFLNCRETEEWRENFGKVSGLTNCNCAYCFVWVWTLVAHIEGVT